MEDTLVPTLVSYQTMSEVVGELGVRDPNCAGISTQIFLSELSDTTIADVDNNAKRICSNCEGRPECKIALGHVSIADYIAEPNAL